MIGPLEAKMQGYNKLNKGIKTKNIQQINNIQNKKRNVTTFYITRTNKLRLTVIIITVSHFLKTATSISKYFKFKLQSEKNKNDL